MKIIANTWETLYGKAICNDDIMFNGEFTDALDDNNTHVLPFVIYDGFAYCEDYNGKEYGMSFPTLAFINSSKTMSNSVRQFVDLKEEEEITVKDILVSYGSLFKIETNPLFPSLMEQHYELNHKASAPKIVTPKVTTSIPQYAGQYPYGNDGEYYD